MSAYVLFFGGYKASLPNIKAWTASAIHQKPGVTFDGYPYPDGASWDGEEAVKAFTKTHDHATAIKKIEASDRDMIYIVGHSSGCAIANAVDAGLKDHTKIILVALDGYAPGNAQLARPSTQVWVAESSTGRSLHYSDLQDRIKDHNLKAKVKTQVKIYQASTNCSTKLSLHFSLVNLSSRVAWRNPSPTGTKTARRTCPGSCEAWREDGGHPSGMNGEAPVDHRRIDDLPAPDRIAQRNRLPRGTGGTGERVGRGRQTSGGGCREYRIHKHSRGSRCHAALLRHPGPARASGPRTVKETWNEYWLPDGSRMSMRASVPETLVSDPPAA